MTIDGETVAEIGQGYLVLLGVGVGDTEKAADAIADRIVKLRIFEDENEKINKSIEDVHGSVIVVSQFTLYADTAHGRRPGFSNAARPEQAIPLYILKKRVTQRQDRSLLPSDAAISTTASRAMLSEINRISKVA